MLRAWQSIPLMGLLVTSCAGEVGSARYPRGEAPAWDGSTSAPFDAGAEAVDATEADARPVYPDAQVSRPDASAPRDAGTPMSGTVTDTAGQVYRTVQIGDQVWMAENLNTSVSGSSYYMNDPSHAAAYGRLYSQSAAMQACMSGWRLPSDQDWMQLEGYLGMSQSELSRDWSQTEQRGTNQGGRLKETGTARWFSPNSGATNDTGFGAQPGGFRGYGGGYGGLGEDGRYWSTSASRYFRADRANLNRYLGGPEYRFSVRCIRN